MKSKFCIHTTALIYENKKVLLVFEDYINKWLLPGGTLEKSETLEECLKRELKEELSIDILNEKIVDDYIHDVSKGITHKVVVFKCDRKKMKIQISENGISKYQWFTKKEITKLDINLQEKQIIQNNFKK